MQDSKKIVALVFVLPVILVFSTAALITYFFS